jgi:hypothetical protein
MSTFFLKAEGLALESMVWEIHDEIKNASESPLVTVA